MKKKIRVNTKILKESSIKVGEKDYAVRLRRRITDLRRVSQMAKEAAEKAEAKGDTELAKKLNDRVEEIEKLLATYNIDTIDPEEVKSEVEDTIKDGTEKDSEEEDDDSEDTDKEESDDEKDDSDEEDEEESSDIDTEDSEETNKQDSKKDNSEENDLEQDNSEPIENTDDDSKPDVDEEDDDSIEGYPMDNDDNDEKIDTEKEEIDSEIEDTNDDVEDSEEENNEESEEEVDTEEDDSEDSENEDDEDSDTDSEETENTKKGSSEKEGSNEEEEEDEEETDDSPVNDPFADEEDIPDLNLGGGMQEPRDATLKDIIKQLKGLSSEGKRGALAALQDIINSRKPTTESLTEAVKGVREMTDDEFGDYINSTYDLIDQVEALDYEDEEELKKKKAKVGQWSTDPKTLKELEAEDDVALEKDFRKEKAREKENTKYAKVGTLDEFKLNFYNAIKHQVEMVIQEYQSYNEINAEYESEDVIMKADLTQEIPEEVIPVIDIYFDVSGSWDSEDIEIGKKAIATVKEFEDAGEIKLNIFYFSNGVSNTFESTRALYGTGTHGWPEILKNIKATEAQNIMIMTDDDIEGIGNAKYGPTCKVDGCVWFLWRNGLASPSCVSHLIGRQGNYQYAFYRNV